MGDYTRVITDFSQFPLGSSEGPVGNYWYHEDTQAYFDDKDQYQMIKAMCRLSCSVCDRTSEQSDGSVKRWSRFRNIDQLKSHLYHRHKLFMCTLCLECRKVCFLGGIISSFTWVFMKSKNCCRYLYVSKNFIQKLSSTDTLVAATLKLMAPRVSGEVLKGIPCVSSVEHLFMGIMNSTPTCPLNITRVTYAKGGENCNFTPEFFFGKNYKILYNLWGFLMQAAFRAVRLLQKL